MKNLPNELTDNIFSFLSSKESLSSCSLVCSSWTDLAHRHIFHKIVYPRDQRSVPDFSALLLFLRGAPSVAQHVRILNLSWGKNKPLSILGPDVFAGLLGTLPNLDHVEMSYMMLSYEIENGEHKSRGEGWFWDGDIEPESNAVVESGRCLKSLKLECVEVGGSNPYFTLFQFLRTIKSLHTLQVSQLTNPAPKKSIASIREFCSSLGLPSHLGIQKYICQSPGSGNHLAVVVFLETLRRAPPCTLRHLDLFQLIGTNQKDTMHYLKAFLNDVGTGLETLSISLNGSDTEGESIACLQCFRQGIHYVLCKANLLTSRHANPYRA